jgi:uncharacterized protein (TIGR02145 family)
MKNLFRVLSLICFLVFITACSKDPETQTPTVKVNDIDGNVYNTVTIGTQIWMAENLKTTKYSDGTNIPLVNSNTSWASLPASSKAYSWYNNDLSNKNVFGALYTWSAATNGAAISSSNPSNVQGVCPTGWHLPSKSEFDQLINYLGGMTIAYTKLLQGGTSGFNAVSGGMHDYDGNFAVNGAFFWFSDRLFVNLSTTPQAISWSEPVAPISWNRAFSVRCVKN